MFSTPRVYKFCQSVILSQILACSGCFTHCLAVGENDVIPRQSAV